MLVNHNVSRILISFAFLFLIVTVSAQDTTSFIDLNRIRRATVYILQMEDTGRGIFTRCVGSGTIVDRRGLIVSNAHNTVPNPECPGDILVIALSINPDEPPIPTYRAELIQVDEGLDLALIRITEELSGRTIELDTLFLPFVELGDSDQVLLDDTIRIAGYAGIGNEAADVIVGTVSGFVAEPSGGERSWIKTDAAIPGAMSGGGIYNENGRLVGVSTTVPVTTTESGSCFPLEDTNHDNLVNQDDGCVPVGGFINALRPSEFVRPLLRSASLGISVDKLSEPPVPDNIPLEPSFSRLLISPAVTNGQPATVAGRLPSGTTSLFLFFDYTNMTPNTIYELRVLRDNIPDPRFSLAPVRWSGGRNGTWFIGSSSSIWPNGRYTFELFINGRSSQNIQIDIGPDPATPPPSFRNISFGLEVDNNLIGTGNVLPAGTRVTARFIHQNMTTGTPWTVIWYYNGLERNRQDLIWGEVEQQAGTNLATVRLATQDGTPLLPGQYRLELYIEGQLAARSDFVIAGANEGPLPRAFSDIRFANANLQTESNEAAPSTNFPNNIDNVVALFDWEFIAPGTLWRMRWSVDNVVFFDQIAPWQETTDGSGFITHLRSTGGIPDGTYRLDLLINNIILAQGEFEIGIGQLPIDPFASAEGVQLNGHIIDAETGEDLPGVTFLLISEDFSVEDFVWDQDQVYAIAVTDRNGRFQLDRLLQYDAPYSVVIAADGYLQVSADGILVDQESPNPQEFVIPLTRG